MKSNDYLEIGGLRFRPTGMEEYIKSPEDAKIICKCIGSILSKYKLDNLLVKIHDDLLDNAYPENPKFIFASLIKFILLNSSIHSELASIPEEEIKELLRMITEYELYDPYFRKI